MAYQQITGDGLWWGCDPGLISIAGNGGFSSILIDASTEKAAFTGRVWFPGRTGTKDIRRVGFRFGTVTKAGGSALTVSLQDVALAAGPPTQPDETQDQTVAIANGDAAFASNTWYRTGTFSADRTVTYGDRLAVVIEYDGGGRLGADAVNIAVIPWQPVPGVATPALKSAGTWAQSGNDAGNLLLEFSDGSFGRLDVGLPIKTFNSHAFNSGSTPDEHALAFTVPVKCKVDALRAVVRSNAATDNFDLVLYSGTTVLQTASVDSNEYRQTSVQLVTLPIPETELVTGTTYYLSVKPTTTNSPTAYSLDVDDANHLTTYPGGTGWTYSTRTDGGAWAAVTTTRQFLAGVRVSSLDDGAGAGGHGGARHIAIGGFSVA